MRLLLAFLTFSCVAAQWEMLPDIPTGALQEHGVAQLAGAIYLLGGFNASLDTVATVNRFDVATGVWDTVSDMPTPVHHPSVGVVGGKLYMLAGLTGLEKKHAGVAFVYDPTTDRWTNITPMGKKFDRGASGVAVVGKRIYVMGGLRKKTAVNTFSVYNTKTDKWDHSLPPIPGLPRDHLVGASVNKKVYAIGGRDTQIKEVNDEVLMYDPKTNEWVNQAPMPTARAGIAGAVVGDMIVVVGGEGNVEFETGVFPQVEVYDALGDVWSDAGMMVTPRHGMQAAAYNGSVYVPGGATATMSTAVAKFEKFTPPARR